MKKIFSVGYRLLFHFELGKNSIGRFSGIIPDILIYLGALKYLFHIDLTIHQMIFGTIGLLVAFMFLGLIIHKTGLYEIEQKVRASKDPVASEIYESAKKINKYYWDIK